MKHLLNIHSSSADLLLAPTSQSRRNTTNSSSNITNARDYSVSSMHSAAASINDDDDNETDPILEKFRFLFQNKTMTLEEAKEKSKDEVKRAYNLRILKSDFSSDQTDNPIRAAYDEITSTFPADNVTVAAAGGGSSSDSSSEEPQTEDASSCPTEECNSPKYFESFLLLSWSSWFVLLLLLCLALLCNLVGAARVFDCDDKCHCEANIHNSSINDTLFVNDTLLDIKECHSQCINDNWALISAGICLQGFVFIVVAVMAMLLLKVDQILGYLGLRILNRAPFRSIDDGPHPWSLVLDEFFRIERPPENPMPIICVIVLHLLCLFFVFMKLSLQSNGWGWEFVENISWHFCFSFDYAAYIIIFWYWLFFKIIKRPRFLVQIIDCSSSMCPLAFLILVAFALDGEYGQRINGFAVASPVLAFIFLRIIGYLIRLSGAIRYGSCFFCTILLREKWKTLLALVLCIPSLVLSAIAIDTEKTSPSNTTPCEDRTYTKWLIAFSPFAGLVSLVAIVSIIMTIYLRCYWGLAHRLLGKHVEFIRRPTSERERLFDPGEDGDDHPGENVLPNFVSYRPSPNIHVTSAQTSTGITNYGTTPTPYLTSTSDSVGIVTSLRSNNVVERI